MPVHLSNNCLEVTVDRRCNYGAGYRGYGWITCKVMCQIRVGLSQRDDGIIPSTWLFLDTFSTSSIGKNPDMFKNIQECLED